MADPEAVDLPLRLLLLPDESLHSLEELTVCILKFLTLSLDLLKCLLELSHLAIKLFDPIPSTSPELLEALY